MPLTNKGESILNSMRETYPSEAKAKEVFYASKNAHTISGVDAMCRDADEIDDVGQSVLHAVDAEYPMPGQLPGIRINETGQSVLHAIDANGGGNSGAVISPTPELGQSAYQRGEAIPEAKRD
jgi:hypothetical protein